jgi:hypothetical protein
MIKLEDAKILQLPKQAQSSKLLLLFLIQSRSVKYRGFGRHNLRLSTFVISLKSWHNRTYDLMAKDGI